MKVKCLCENNVISILYFVEYVRHKFTRACEIEQDNLKQNQAKMKQWYDNDAIIREFKSGEKVIVLLLTLRKLRRNRRLEGILKDIVAIYVKRST